MSNLKEAIENGRTSLGIELGSTRIKAVLIGEDGVPAASGGHTWENQYENGVWTYSLEAVRNGLQDAYAKLAADVEKKLADYELPAGYQLVSSGENEMIQDAMEQIVLMLILAVLFMYLIMVAQFQSLLSPFIIMFTIPLAFTGGFLGLYVSGSEVSVIAMIGFVMLAGVIVNNGIVLIDYMNQLRE